MVSADDVGNGIWRLKLACGDFLRLV